MKRSYLIVLLACFGFAFAMSDYSQLNAQVYVYTLTYDACGNLTSRVGTQSSQMAAENQNINASDLKSSEEEIQEKDFLENGIVRIYPNPTDGIITLAFSSTDQDNNREVSVSDLQGKIVYQSQSNATETQIDLTDQPKGSYILTIKIGSEIQVYKLLKK